MRVFPRGDEARELPVVENQEHRLVSSGLDARDILHKLIVSLTSA